MEVRLDQQETGQIKSIGRKQVMYMTSELRPEIAEFLHQLAVVQAFSPKTIEAYTFDLTQFCAFLGEKSGIDWKIENIDQYSIKKYIEYLAGKGLAPITRGRRLATLKSLFGYLYSQGKIKSNPTSQVRMPKRRDKEPSYLSEEEYKRLLKAVKDNASRYYIERDTAILTMLIGTGIRLNELVELNVGDVDFNNRTIKFIRKGNHEKIIPVNAIVITAIKRYLKTRKGISPSAPLFLSKRDRRIDTASIQHLVRKYCMEAHIEKKGLSPHMLRHSFAVALLKNGESLFTIQQLLSHQNIRTTEKYLHLNNEDLKTAVNKIRL